jgi:DNA-binding response OmpR family regulator
MDHQDLEAFYLGTTVMEQIITLDHQDGPRSSASPVVLILEDFDAIRAWTTHHLEHQGYDVYSAATLHDALQLAKEAEPQLILIDYDMSGEDAIWAVGQLRGLAPSAFILVLGGPGTPTIEHQTIEAGASQVLSHAYDVHMLDDIIAHSRVAKANA